MKRAAILLLPLLAACPSADKPQSSGVRAPRLVESAATPDMVADLHRRESEYFARATSNAIRDEKGVVPVVWERLESPDGPELFRTEIPDGWLVVLVGVGYQGHAAAIVSDSAHAWRTDRLTTEGD